MGNTMKKMVYIAPLVLVLASGCSGLLPNPFEGGGKIVSVEYLSKYEGGGSLSTLWYRGSDNKYHYFTHYVKASTKYKVYGEDLKWDNEFRINSGNKQTLVDGQLSKYVSNNL